MNSKNRYTLNLKFYITIFSLLMSLIAFTSLQTYAQTNSTKPAYFYIDCIENNNENYYLGIRDNRSPNRALIDMDYREAIPPHIGLSLPGDRITRVRFGFMDKNMNKIPNKFVQLGPLKNWLYVSFPCSDSGFCLLVTDETNGTIKSKYAGKKTKLRGCP
ncbi:MAG: hypothetical protein VKL41_21920 [Snowella sp.]|nr:hypothetical protein [Snowella sp.]